MTIDNSDIKFLKKLRDRTKLETYTLSDLFGTLQRARLGIKQDGGHVIVEDPVKKKSLTLTMNDSSLVPFKYTPARLADIANYILVNQVGIMKDDVIKRTTPRAEAPNAFKTNHFAHYS